MPQFDEIRHRVIAGALRGDGVSTPSARRAAFDRREVDPRVAALVDKVCERAWEITDEDVKSAIDAGLGEDEVFELVVCAALGQAERQLDAACHALDRAEVSRE